MKKNIFFLLLTTSSLTFSGEKETLKDLASSTINVMCRTGMAGVAATAALFPSALLQVAPGAAGEKLNRKLPHDLQCIPSNFKREVAVVGVGTIAGALAVGAQAGFRGSPQADKAALACVGVAGVCMIGTFVTAILKEKSKRF